MVAADPLHIHFVVARGPELFQCRLVDLSLLRSCRSFCVIPHSSLRRSRPRPFYRRYRLYFESIVFSDDFVCMDFMKKS